ncbi:MAG TPA: 2-oxoglutarate dehydrogenase, E2 component, dihydrolipoamide succinyltransferase [Pyrinomonadaceae bacterium]|nr:2-oxoglutarate dehydrogenase, E2 component, dihydrolipoamide succinyltransferase [Pyrinomonadaceae bacterium]
MSTEVVMPQMGESIAEGTITKWLKKVGEKVERDEPLFEISTDKVDAEIPSPAAGTLTEVRFKEGDTVEVNTVVAVLDGDGSSPSVKSVSPEPVPVEPPPPPVEAKPEPPPPPPPVAPPPPPAPAKSAEPTVEELRRTKSSPLVRKIAQEHNVDISKLEGTGLSGRVTKNDILSFIESGSTTAAPAPSAAPSQPATPAAAPSAPAPSAPAPSLPAELPAPPPPRPQMGDRVESMSVMRKKIAEHMVLSRRTSAHVTTVYEIDMTRVAKLREKHRDSFYERTGTKLTFMPFIFEAVNKGLRQFPIFNAQVSGEQIIYKQDINLGMAVALDWGLIVPVIKRADDLSISGLARAANDLADRARTKQLKPDEVTGGTFTITNPGVFGGLFGTPIINQPQLAILGVGKIEKRPKVMTNSDGDDFLAIRWMAYFALSFDHRVIDGADAERFLAFVKEQLESGDFSV